ncbi:DUF349 domain-containing protein [Marinobacterium sediminicola]|uniref:DUF349 domain-containing protein n=1 Tax=Marinobacterium sediminicola TaxID=518898 RepID=A0ABY1RWS4_9GAMM|nr:DUF349 domain-containing protein [Marinobacterium sediminicola]ULG70239.1 DUF349 domain-containing protein [Marinobacterium sediminicola]SMR70002.1 protein of unknown function [Marinobacterium sediminicola]
MFANLFKPKWRHSNPEVRASAVNKLRPDHPEQAGILCQLALSDSNRQVRLQAVQRLADKDSLLMVLRQSDDAEIREQAGIRVSQCLNGDEDPNSLCQLLELINDDSARTQIIINSNNAQLETGTLNNINDESVLLQIALHARLANIRKEAVQRIEDATLLEQVQRATRGRDKAVHRISRDKLNSLREQSRLQAEASLRRQQLLTQLHQLATTEDTQFLQARAQALYQEWQQQPNIEGNEQQTFDNLKHTIEQRLNRKAEAEAQAARERAEQQAREDQAKSLLDQLAATESQSTDQMQWVLTELQAKWQALAQQLPSQLQQQWQESYDNLATLASARARLEQQSQTIAQLLQQDDQPLTKRLRKIRELLALVDWPSSEPRPEALQQLHALADELKQQQNALSQEARQQETAIRDQLTELEQAIDSGNLADANRLHQSVGKRIEKLNVLLPDALDNHYRLLNARLAELHDWQGFAAAGKKESLCEQMEALIGAELPPQELADQVRALQLEWKQIDATDSVHSQKLWKRFQEAGEKAYAPCQTWFKAQRQQREFNLAQRQQICTQLRTYLHQMDWNQADWPAVEAVSRAAREEWRRYTPVDRAPGKPLQQEFNTLLRELDHHIKEHRQHCADIKEQLIARAVELAEAEDINAAADEAKQLQKLWKAAGPTFRSRERALWQAFREACDQIFGRLKETRKEEARHQRKQASEQARQPLADVAVDALQRLAVLAEQAEEELANNGSSETLATLLTEAITGPSPGDFWRERIGQRLEAIRLISAGTRSIEQQLVLSDRQARELCIRLEILLGVPSPESDEALRMEYQMERLNQALAQQDDEPTPAALQALELEWLTLPFAWQFGELHERFAGLLQDA